MFQARQTKQKSLVFVFTMLSAIALGIFVLSSVWFGWRYYNHRVDAIELRLETQAARIERSLSDTITTATVIANYIGGLLQPHTDNNASIARILKSTIAQRELMQDTLSLSMFSWVDKNFHLTINSEKGLLDDPKALYMRDYLHRTKKHPGTIQLGDPVAGSVSSQWIIPAGIGVTNDAGNYAGTLVVGFNMMRMAKKLQSSITQEGITYTIIDQDLNTVLPSPINNSLTKIPHALAKLDEIFDSPATSGLLHTPNPFRDNANFILYYKTDYPYIILVSYDKRLSDAEINEALLTYLLEFFIIGLFILVLLLGIRNYILSPILALSSIANTIAKGEKVEAFPEAKTLEINTLSAQLKRVVEYTSKLRTAQQELLLAHERVKLANESLEQKVIERTKVLEQTLQGKTDFINNISHEVRSPIQGVTVISGGLVNDWPQLSEEKRFSYAQEIHKSGERLLNLVNSLLDFSKLNAGKMEFAMAPYTNLTAIADEIIQECSLLLGKKPVTIVLESPNIVLAELDRQRIGQVIRNLLANAIKFTAKGTITLSLSHRPFNRLNGGQVAGVAFTITDEGVGIPEEEIEHIFQPFAQSSRTKSRAGGTGLGLTICHEIITAHHGIIYAAHNAKKGASFTFIIPLEQPLISTERSPIPMHTENENDNINILIVDDEIHCLISMRIILEGQGYNIIEAESGVEALVTLNANAHKIDVILLDLMMPDMYGTEVLIAIRQDERFEHIPVIIQSGAANDIEINKALQSGACAHIRKPYNRVMLLETIGAAMQEKII